MGEFTMVLLKNCVSFHSNHCILWTVRTLGKYLAGFQLGLIPVSTQNSIKFWRVPCGIKFWYCLDSNFDNAWISCGHIHKQHVNTTPWLENSYLGWNKWVACLATFPLKMPALEIQNLRTAKTKTSSCPCWPLLQTKSYFKTILR